MVKRTTQKNDPSGDNTELYLWDDLVLKPSTYFIYKVCLYKYWSNGFCQLGNKLFKSDRFLNIKYIKKRKKYNGFFIEKTIELIGAPYGFIKENDLPIYNQIIKQKTKKK